MNTDRAWAQERGYLTGDGTPGYLASPAAFAVRCSEGRWTPAPHLRLQNRLAVQLAGRHINRLVVTTPPRHGKSEFWSHWFPAWWLSVWPQQRVILTSYEAGFAETWGRAVRNTLDDAAARDLIPDDARLAGDSTSASRWNTRAGGGMVTAGAGGAITGRGANAFVIDDPYKNRADADSKLIRRRIWNWWESTARTRLEPGGIVVLVLTRWHEDDIGGRFIQDGWPVLRLPAIADHLGADGQPTGEDPIGRDIGAALWPDRYDETDMAGIRADVGDYVWSALFQGLPTPAEGGGLWTRDQMREARTRYMSWGSPTREDFTSIVVSVDPPGGRTECGIVVVGLLAEDRAAGLLPRGVVLDDRSVPGGERWAPHVVDAYREWGADRVVAETNYGGDMVAEVITAEDRTIPVTVVNASRGKRVRAEPVEVLYRRARIAHAGQFTELEAECCRWEPDAGMESPNRMDALVWACTSLRLIATDDYAEAVNLRGRGREPVVQRGDLTLRGDRYVDKDPS